MNIQRKKGSIFLAILLVIGLIGISTVVFLKNPNSINRQNQLPSPSTIPEPDLGGWKTYNNEKYGFEFKYPSDWIEKEKINTEDYTVEFTSPDLNTKFVYEGGDWPAVIYHQGALLSFKVGTNSSYKSYDELKKSEWGHLKNAKEISINGVKALFSDLSDVDSYGQEVQFINKSISSQKLLSYQMVLNSSLKEKDNYNHIFNQILSTLKLFDFLKDKVTIANQTILSKVKLPDGWSYYKDVDTKKFIYAASKPNELLMGKNNCLVFNGFGGTEGPTNDLTNEQVVISDIKFNKRSWYSNKKVILISYVPEENVPWFEFILAQISDQNHQNCLDDVNKIVYSLVIVK